MPIVPAKTWVDGDPLLASELNTYVSGILTSLMNPPSCKVYRAAIQTFGAAVFTEVLWTHELWDTAAMHSTVSNTGRITVPQAGVYKVDWNVRLGAVGINNNMVLIRLYHNGAMVDETQKWMNTAVSNYAECTGGAQLKASASDYFQLFVYSANACNVDVGTVPTLAATWIGNG